jgi:hypothetical protein
MYWWSGKGVKKLAFEYKRVELNSAANFALAEQLVAQGWKIVQSGLFSVLLEKKSKLQTLDEVLREGVKK